MRYTALRAFALVWLVLTAACAVSPEDRSGISEAACSWNDGDLLRAKDSGGRITFLRSPIEHDDLSVLAILQQYGPIPGLYGDALLRGVDQGVVRPYRGPGFMRWYFHADVPLPATLPYTDSKGRCKAQSPVRPSGDFPGWVFVQVPHWARLNVPTELLLAGPVCARPRGIGKALHVPAITEGSFKGASNVLCGLPGRMEQLVEEGFNGILFFYVVP